MNESVRETFGALSRRYYTIGMPDLFEQIEKMSFDELDPLCLCDTIASCINGSSYQAALTGDWEFSYSEGDEIKREDRYREMSRKLIWLAGFSLVPDTFRKAKVLRERLIHEGFSPEELSYAETHKCASEEPAVAEILCAWRDPTRKEGWNAGIAWYGYPHLADVPERHWEASLVSIAVNKESPLRVYEALPASCKEERDVADLCWAKCETWHKVDLLKLLPEHHRSAERAAECIKQADAKGVEQVLSCVSAEVGERIQETAMERLAGIFGYLKKETKYSRVGSLLIEQDPQYDPKEIENTIETVAKYPRRSRAIFIKKLRAVNPDLARCLKWKLGMGLFRALFA